MRKYIFTFNYSINYGAFLQCFALSNFGKDFVVADLTPRSLGGIKYTVGPYGRKKMPVVWIFLAIYRFMKNFFVYRWYKFKECKFLNLSYNEKKWDAPSVKKYLDGNIAIVGSDQIWNPKMIEGMENVYFAGIANFSKRIAYAASLGMTKWPDEFKEQVLKKLETFNAISVREESAVKYLYSIGLKNVAWVCDPTLLYGADFYRRNFNVGYFQKKDYVFHYVIRERISSDFLNSLGRNVVSVNAGNRKNFVSVSEWLNYISNSDYVVTDSFHCVVFCLLFHKKFVVALNNSRGSGMNERFYSLLGRTDLMSRCVKESDSIEVMKEKLCADVDWNRVDIVIDEWRQYSMNWLNTALES